MGGSRRLQRAHPGARLQTHGAAGRAARGEGVMSAVKQAPPPVGGARTRPRARTWPQPAFWRALPPPWRSFILWALCFGLAILYPLLDTDSSHVDTAVSALSYAMLALGLNIVVGYAGLLDLGYAAFFAIGAYAFGMIASAQFQPSAAFDLRVGPLDI